VSDIFVQQQNSRIAVVGKLTKATATIIINGTTVLLESIVTEATDIAPLAVVWAGLKAREIAVTTNDTKELLALGRDYGIITPGTSLLVLESIGQYLKYDLYPPDMLPEMQQKFIKAKRKRATNIAKQQRAHQAQVIEWWEERKAWWATDHKTAYPQVLAERAEELAIDKLWIQLRHLSESTMPNMSRSHNFPPADIRTFCLHDPVQNNSDYSEELFADSDDYKEDYEDTLETKAVIGTIHIQGWSPKNSYMKKIRQTPVRLQYEHYIELRRDYTNSPSFFLDCGNHFLEQGELELGVRVLSNLEELQLGDVALLRIYAWRLQQEKLYDQAINIFERIRSIRDDEPQSHRDLALVLVDRWETNNKSEDALRAMALLYTVIDKTWERFPAIEIIALMELNRNASVNYVKLRIISQMTIILRIEKAKVKMNLPSFYLE
jgi:hypothetical protein